MNTQRSYSHSKWHTHTVSVCTCMNLLVRPEYGNAAQPWFCICKTLLETRKQFLEM